MLDGGESFHLVNVLPKMAFEKQHIPGSIHHSFYSADFIERIQALCDDAHDKIVTYCNSRSCNAATKAADALRAAGFSQVSVFLGGLEEWRSDGYPVAGTAR